MDSEQVKRWMIENATKQFDEDIELFVIQLSEAACDHFGLWDNGAMPYSVVAIGEDVAESTNAGATGGKEQ